jgi:hypothetical protein
MADRAGVWKIRNVIANRLPQFATCFGLKCQIGRTADSLASLLATFLTGLPDVPPGRPAGLYFGRRGKRWGNRPGIVDS